MATKKFDSFNSLTTTKSEWRVPSRVLNLWRGYRKTGEPFKGFNLLLLDHKRSRVHAFVPYNLADQFEAIIEIGNLYLLTNFTVKEYTTDDKFRCLRKHVQIVFNEETQLDILHENVVNVENCCFDFFEISELHTLSKQNTYLTDVVGIMEDHEPIRKIKNRNDVIQSQFVFNITDGSSSVRVTFWDDFAKHLADSLKQATDFPVILIIGCARVTTWGEQVVVTNVGATNFYINCNHRSVVELRKLLLEKKITSKSLSTENRSAVQFYKLESIPRLGPDHVERQIFCKVKITNFQENKIWFKTVCTSCYATTVKLNSEDTCQGCQRVVQYPDKQFQLVAMAFDDTGYILIIMEDREVKKLVGKSVFQIGEEGTKDEEFPPILNNILGKVYTLKIRINSENVLKKSNYYLVTDIMEGLYLEGNQQQ
ncbi:replication protein A 70 kDa DNA-binding subunit B-like [Daucus carota subsp. sativus]|uniref:replication protein A 70 kDa DNA-binding subunit B-like n=1 Tax=Daucus carota subsp. sativus TaxID=79200 RepID=UPI0007EF1F73|nr:PREDICTED: replication protein A 70 kDa DNA-binding subunit B-like [Daucus carota subsp. sativus]